MPPDGVSNATSLGELITGIYSYALEIVGLCVFVMFLYAGYQVMFGNRSQAIRIMQDAAVGLIILFSAYVILNSINPDLVERSGDFLNPGNEAR